MDRTPVVQFGTSRFLQAHVDLFVHEVRAAGRAAGPIAVVASSGTSGRGDRLAAFNDPAGYPIIVRGLRDGAPVEEKIRVTSVVRGLDAAADWSELVRRVVEEAEFIVSNTTEAGFAVPEGLVVDWRAPERAAPPSFPGKLLALLAARHAAGRPGLVVLPTELVGRNGDVLRDTVVGLARRSAAPETLIDFIETDCIFANSLVDRIVSTPLEPAGAVAEPYALWAIENRPGLRVPCEHPAIRVVDDLEPYERLKVHILNLGHTVLAERWQAEGRPADETVRAMLADPKVLADLTDLYDREVVPGFAARGLGEAAADYVRTVLERFRNPYLDHRLSDIAANHAVKVDRRVAAFIDWAAAEGAPAMPRLEALARIYAKESTP